MQRIDWGSNISISSLASLRTTPARILAISAFPFILPPCTFQKEPKKPMKLKETVAKGCHPSNSSPPSLTRLTGFHIEENLLDEKGNVSANSVSAQLPRLLFIFVAGIARNHNFRLGPVTVARHPQRSKTAYEYAYALWLTQTQNETPRENHNRFVSKLPS